MKPTDLAYTLLIDESEVQAYPLFDARDIEGLRKRAEVLAPQQGQTGHYFYQEILSKWIDELSQTQIDKERMIQISADKHITEEDFLIAIDKKKQAQMKSLESKTFLTKQCVENYRQAMEEISQKIQFALSNENYRETLEQKTRLAKEKKEENEIVFGPNEASLLYPIEIAELENQLDTDLAKTFSSNEDDYLKKEILAPLLKELKHIKVNTSLNQIKSSLHHQNPLLLYAHHIDMAASKLGQLRPSLDPNKTKALTEALSGLKQNTRQIIKKINPRIYKSEAGGDAEIAYAQHKKELKKLQFYYYLYLIWTPFNCILSNTLTLFLGKFIFNSSNNSFVEGPLQMMVDFPISFANRHNRSLFSPYHSINLIRSEQKEIEAKINSAPKKALMP